jgi:hypothetical protein
MRNFMLLAFDNLAEATAAKNLTENTLIITKGYYVPGDGGGATYLAKSSTTSTPDKIFVIENDNGFILELMHQGEINIRQAGAKSDDMPQSDEIDNYAILNQVINYNPYPENKIFKVTVTEGTYQIEQTLTIKKVVHLFGQGGYLGRSNTSTLQFPKNTTGILVKYYEPPEFNEGSQFSIIEGLTIAGDRDLANPLRILDRNHGILINSPIKVANCSIQNFNGDGIHLFGNCSAPIPTQTNANLFYLDHVSIVNVDGNGIYLNGECANAGKVIGASSIYIGRFGILDESFLGNTYIGCHAATAELRGNCFHKGRYYRIRVDLADLFDSTSRKIANEKFVSAIEPGVTPGWERYWQDLGPGAEPDRILAPQWTATDKYVKGGAYHSVRLNATSVFCGCYAENDSPVRINTASLALGGIAANGDNCYLTAAGGGDETGLFSGGAFANRLGNGNRNYTHKLGSTTTTFRTGQFVENSISSLQNSVALEYQGAKQEKFGLSFTTYLADKTNGMPWTITTDNYEQGQVHGGREQSLPSGNMMFEQGFFLGSAEYARYQGNSGSAPTANTAAEFGRGDILWNTNPAQGGYVGWVCVKPGKPGEWLPFGKIE